MGGTLSISVRMPRPDRLVRGLLGERVRAIIWIWSSERAQASGGAQVAVHAESSVVYVLSWIIEERIKQLNNRVARRSKSSGGSIQVINGSS